MTIQEYDVVDPIYLSHEEDWCVMYLIDHVVRLNNDKNQIYKQLKSCGRMSADTFEELQKKFLDRWLIGLDYTEFNGSLFPELIDPRKLEWFTDEICADVEERIRQRMNAEVKEID